MKQALRQLGEDFLSAILFFAIYALTGSLAVGVGLAAAIGLLQFCRQKRTGRRVEAMQMMSLALVAVLGGASLVFSTPRFIMAKPSIIHLSIAAIMLRRGWVARYLPPIVVQHVPKGAIDAAGYAWAALLAMLAVANLVIATQFSVATWGWFVSFGLIGAKAAAFGLQYAMFRIIVTRRITAARRAAGTASGLAYRPMIAE